MMVLSGQADATEGEQALHRALSDAAFEGSPRRLGEVVLALENLAQKGDANAVERVARRLRDNPGLHAQDRLRLQRIVESCVPQGQGQGQGTPGKAAK
jgi:hypothetical protein